MKTSEKRKLRTKLRPNLTTIHVCQANREREHIQHGRTEKKTTTKKEDTRKGRRADMGAVSLKWGRFDSQGGRVRARIWSRGECVDESLGLLKKKTTRRKHSKKEGRNRD